MFPPTAISRIRERRLHPLDSGSRLEDDLKILVTGGAVGTILSQSVANAVKPSLYLGQIRSKNRLGAVAAILLLALPIAGCGESTEQKTIDLKDQVVTGKVQLAGGKPLTKGRVVFNPVKESDEPLYGKLDRTGSFTLSPAGLGLAGKGLGVTHGEFRVSVETDNYLPGVKPKGLNFPAKYLDPATSGLTATITADTKELPPFVLK